VVKKRGPDGCEVVFGLAGLALAGYLVLKIVRFFQSPDAVQDTLELLEGAVICLGIAVLAFAVITLFGWVSAERKARLIRLSKDYPVRCYPVEPKRQVPTPTPTSLPGAPNQESSDPVWLLLSLTNYGIRLELVPAQDTRDWVSADNASRFNRLSGDLPGPIILPIGHFQLYYVWYRREGNLKFELAPTGQTGYTGDLPAIPSGYQVEVVIVCTAIREVGILSETITRGEALELKLVVLDAVGHDDPGATCEFYTAALKLMHSSDSDEDDTWMYRSRPSIPPWY